MKKIKNKFTKSYLESWCTTNGTLFLNTGDENDHPTQNRCIGLSIKDAEFLINDLTNFVNNNK
tara:strand:- start:75 stop:263 length:189 start_codon:yes stop_codon:yes gene_type:complete